MRREVTKAIAIALVVAIWYTLAGHGSFAAATLNVSLLFRLAYVSTIFVTGLVLSATLSRRQD